MRYRLMFLVIAIALFPISASAQTLSCDYVVTGFNLVDFGMWEAVVPVWGVVCSASIDSSPTTDTSGTTNPGGTDTSGTGGQPPSSGGGGTPLPPSNVTITYVSDENPNDVFFGIAYTGVATNIRIIRNGAQTNYLTGDASIVHVGRLDDMIDPLNSVLVQVCNDGGCGSDTANVSRGNIERDNIGLIAIQYSVKIGEDLVDDVADYHRQVNVRYMTAEWDRARYGLANGQYDHIQVTDTLLWNNNDNPLGTTSPDPVWHGMYRFYPSWLGGSMYEEPESWTSPPPNSFAHASAQGLWPAEYARDGYPQGICHIADTELGTSTVPNTISGDVDVTVSP